MDDALRSDVHPSAGGHLPIVGHTHFFCDFPVVQIVIHADHHGVGDDDPRCFRLAREQTQRMTGFHHQRLVFRQLFQISLNQPVLEPVLTNLPGLSVGNQFIWIQSHFEVQVIFNHDLEGLSCQAFSFIFADRLAVDPSLRPVTVSVDSASGGQFLHELRCKLFMQFFRYIAERILQGDLRLCLRQPETPVRCPADAFLKCRIIRIFISKLDGHGSLNGLIV